MIRSRSLMLGATLVGALVLGSLKASPGQRPSAEPQAAPKPSAEQQQQLDQLKQLEQQLQKDRDALHSAISQFGWDSEQVDAAQEQLFRDRQEYRKMRRSLRAAGVPVPPPAGMGPGGRGSRRGPMAGGGRHQKGGRCHCPCGNQGLE